MTRRETPLDPAAIIRSLNEHGVEYVVIGGVAVQAHGGVRTTLDLDVVPAPGATHLERLKAAVASLGAAPASVEPPGPVVLDTAAGGLDIHFAPPGAPPFAELHAAALELEVDGLRFRVASRGHLIAMKRAAGGPLDRLDIAQLTEHEG